MIPSIVYKGAAAAALLAVIYFQYQLLDSEQDAHKATKLANYQKLEQIAHLTKVAKDKTDLLTAEKQKTVTVIQTVYKDRIKYVKETIKAERDSVVAGTSSMYINASCQGAGSGQADRSDVSDEPTTATGFDGSTLRLGPGAYQAYWDVRTWAEANREQVMGLQKYIREVCQ